MRSQEQLLTTPTELGNQLHAPEQVDEVARTCGNIATNHSANPVESFDEASLSDLDLREAAIKLENDGFVRLAPRLSEQLKDDSRTNSFLYAPTTAAIWNNDPDHDLLVSMTEHEGLGMLSTALADLAAELGEQDIDDALEFGRQLEGIRENLTFIGETEYLEAATGLGAYWRNYLDSNPLAQVCVVTELGTGSRRKSDSYLLERILQTFTEKEREDYAGRIVQFVEDVTAQPEDTKVVLLDDWSISGYQLRDEHHKLAGDKRYQEYQGQIEVNLLVSPEHRIQEGLPVDTVLKDQTPLPVHAYYKAHNAKETATEDRNHYAHVSGTHSSVDYDFEQIIGGSVQYVNAIRVIDGTPGIQVMPPLTNVYRAYRYRMPEAWISREGKITGAPSHREL